MGSLLFAGFCGLNANLFVNYLVAYFVAVGAWCSLCC